jgi:hypothetical protein
VRRSDDAAPVSGCVVENDSEPFTVLAIFEKEETRALDLINGNFFLFGL